ncbi:MAG: ATP-binding protein [Treponema sp.]|nr:ATP-binding protein [Treponema sp.]
MTESNSPGLQSTYYYFFKNAHSAMAIADKWGILVAGNDRFNELIKSLSGTAVDIKSNTAKLGSSFDFLPIHDAVRFSNLLSKLANDDTDSMDFKNPYRDKNDKIHWLRIHAWKMSLDPRVDLSSRGPFIGFIINDDTVEIEAEEKLQEDMRIAEKTMEAKSRFLAAMSHEIRTPIQTIIGMTELLEDTSLNSEQSEYTRQVKYSADVLLSLVNDILDYSKTEAGKMELEQIPFSPSQTVEQAVKMLSLETDKKGLKVILELDGGARQRILGDPGKFLQVLINLIKNAIKFTPEGSITISAVAALGEKRIRTITVSVADTGIGVPEEARERLFTTFMQADSSHTRRFGGTGLGLAICRNMVELMGGTIEMVPNKENGSIFRFTIPAEEADPDTNVHETAWNDLVVPSEQVKPEAGKEFLDPEKSPILLDGAPELDGTRKVLIVEDHPVNRQLFTMIIEKLGVKAISAEDGLDALEKASFNPDLIFMDIQMPRMNGYEAAAELRRRGFTKPLIAVTAGVQEDEQNQCREAGFDDIIFKPFKRLDIEAMFQKWVTGKTRTAAESQMATDKRSAVFSKEDLLDTFMQEAENAKTLMSQFLKRTGEQLEILPVLTKEKNWEEAFRIVHMIKGAAKTLSGMELGDAAARLEKAYKQIDMQEIEAALPTLLEAYQCFTSAAKEFLES